jgi:hypothetical protein
MPAPSRKPKDGFKWELDDDGNWVEVLVPVVVPPTVVPPVVKPPVINLPPPTPAEKWGAGSWSRTTDATGKVSDDWYSRDTDGTILKNGIRMVDSGKPMVPGSTTQWRIQPIPPLSDQQRAQQTEAHQTVANAASSLTASIPRGTVSAKDTRPTTAKATPSPTAKFRPRTPKWWTQDI